MKPKLDYPVAHASLIYFSFAAAFLSTMFFLYPLYCIYMGLSLWYMYKTSFGMGNSWFFSLFLCSVFILFSFLCWCSMVALFHSTLTGRIHYLSTTNFMINCFFTLKYMLQPHEPPKQLFWLTVK